MSSKQINFFLSSEDLPEVSQFLIDKGCIIFKRNGKTSSVILNKYDIIKNSENIFQVCLTKESYQNNIYYEYLESSDSYYVDFLKSYCIEFSIGGFYPYSNKEFHASRLYYVFSYYEGDMIIDKDKNFISWSDDLIKTFKKKFLNRVPQYSNDFFSVRSIALLNSLSAKRSVDGSKFVLQ
jgi:hypothetical protein